MRRRPCGSCPVARRGIRAGGQFGVPAVAVLVTGLCCAAAAVPEPTDVRRLIREQTDYAALAPDVRARTPRPASGAPPLSKSEAEHVEELILLLDDRMADLDPPVRVLCGGREIAVATPKRTVVALTASLVARGDRRLIFGAELAVKPTDTTAALEGKPFAGAE